MKYPLANFGHHLRTSRVSDTTRRMLDGFDKRPELHGLPGFFFTDESVYEADLELIFHHEWLFAGHSVELSEPGSFKTLQVGSYPIAVVRGSDDGLLRAFHNVCRHRGHTVCTAPRGKAPGGGKRLVCPYHQWAYDTNDGALLSARDLTASLDRSSLGLKPVHLQEVGSYVFISVAATPPAFEPVREMVARYSEPFALSDTKVAFQSRIVERANWKIVWENNRECYHCAGNHPELSRSFPSSSSGSLPSTEEIAFSEHAESLGMPSAFARADDFQYRATRLPFVSGAASMTLSGRPAVHGGMRLGRMPEENMGDVLFYHYPTTWNHWMGDHALSFRALPLSPTTTEVITTWLVPSGAVEGVDFNVTELTEVWEATNRQDKELVEAVQEGVTSPAFTPGPYCPTNEDGVLDFIKWYQTLVRQRLRLW